MSRARAVLASALWCAAAAAVPATAAQRLPPEVQAALQRARVPATAISVVVQDADNGRPTLLWRPHEAVNPASLSKLLTTAAALDMLGPTWRWRTPVWLVGPLRDGVLEGPLVIKGSGDPTLVLERVWLLLRRAQALGVREIRGDIVLDASAFDVPDSDAGEFDGEALRPYNVRSAALLLNFRSVIYTFVPDADAGVARVIAEPGLAGTEVDRSVPLAAGPCGDWRATLKANFEPGRTRFAGAYPRACGELAWPVADPQPTTYDARLIEALWRGMGGQLHGSVRAGTAPTDRPPTFEMPSPPLAEVVRDINKFSNNMMAQQLFLTLALQEAPQRAATPEAARQALTRWVAARTSDPGRSPGAAGGPAAPADTDDALFIDNGSGLSRTTRISAQRLARLLQQAYDSPVMSELMSSLPVSGLDGTLRRSRATPGRAHLKTGSLRDVAGVAGYVLSNNGRRVVLVAIVNHPQAAAAQPALDALVLWALHDTPVR